MIRVSIAVGAVSTVAGVISRCDYDRSSDQFTYYKEKGFPKRFTPNLPVRPKPMPFVLLGVGKMDLLQRCVVGIAVGPSTLTRAKRWLAGERSGKENTFSLLDHLLVKENIITPYSISNPAKIGVTLRMSSPITTRQLIRALDRYLPAQGHDILLDHIEGALGRDSTLATGEELSFYWFDNEELYILHNGEIYDVIHMPYLSRSLLQIFVGPDDNIVSCELYRSITDRLPTIADT